MDSKNVIAAIALSSAVIVLWSLFFIPEQQTINQDLVEKEKIEKNTDTPSLDQKEKVVALSRDDALIQNKRIEFIGSGYHQIISPLNNFEINNYNITYGKKIYESLLNYSPKIYLINEQAFDTTSLEMYYSNNINNIIIDNNISINELYIENTNKPNYLLYKNEVKV